MTEHEEQQLLALRDEVLVAQRHARQLEVAYLTKVEQIQRETGKRLKIGFTFLEVSNEVQGLQDGREEVQVQGRQEEDAVSS